MDGSTNKALSFRYRGLIGLILLLPVVLLLVFSRPTITDGSILDIITDFMGWFLFVTYAVFRLWATLYAGGRKDKTLETDGPYSITRNPLYFGSLCFALSAAFFCKSIILVTAVLALWLIYSHWIVVSEERYLESIFGEEYRKYCQLAPRFIPDPFLYHANQHISVEVRPLEKEVKRIAWAALMPIGIEILMHLRSLSWWPHWFTLP